ncbi:peptidoglycan bridge formation glycyltransferase FemA/FemB family protein [Actinomyces sp. zg-332]|uniref:lipid II:glycine glycyltransferase FemX n=1 Tax=Actinomyces sp. zg-332 TaxID=2708340 RepID=UPI0014244B9C|nr:peptidoglycan bridge formation glycyltransferase FemA/FemB family protein [Actinomyces sp. zg-332]QPK94158.1 peptidoglycan bridge formation glycyltransferase FemA/FemB family protein [Actinomyces sp. zg-332]
MSSLSIIEVDEKSYINFCKENNISLPIEQSVEWESFSLSRGHSLWKRLVITNDSFPIAVTSLYEYHAGGFKYLWARNSPVFSDNSKSYEKEVCLALRDFVRKHDSKVIFLRLNITENFTFTRPVVRIIPYDKTVILNIQGSDEDILSRMKPRGRRDVRKGLRVSGMECFEESKTILGNFDELYEIMVETANRDNFVPNDADFYKNMISTLGEKCKVFVGRIDGQAVCWSITTIHDGLAVQYYAATSKIARSKNCYDQLIYFCCCYLRDMGIANFDLMAIGSDFSPKLLGLNEFKTKFSKEIVDVAPSRDIVCNSRLYFLFSVAYKTKQLILKLISRR